MNFKAARTGEAVSDSELTFSTESLIAEAKERTGGRDDFGEPQFLEGLERFLRSLRDDAYLNDIGQHIAKARAMGHTVNRLNYIGDRKQYPAIAEQKIVKPVF